MEIQELFSEFECPVCLDIPRKESKIFQCNNGHMLCQQCHAKLTFCPSCNKKLGNIRCLVAEKCLRQLFEITGASSKKATLEIAEICMCTEHRLTRLEQKRSTQKISNRLEIDHCKPIGIYHLACSQMIEKAEKCHVDGKLERAYFLYSKYADFLEEIPAHPEHTSKKTVWSDAVEMLKSVGPKCENLKLLLGMQYTNEHEKTIPKKNYQVKQNATERDTKEWLGITFDQLVLNGAIEDKPGGEPEHIIERKICGTVKSFSAELGHGFITRDDIHENVFVHQTHIVTHKRKKSSQRKLSVKERLEVGDLVEFDVVYGESGPAAVNVCPLILDSRIWTVQTSAKKESNCYKCGMAGHFSRDCSASGNMERNMNCYGCGQEGHFRNDCKADQKKSYDQVVCYECKETRHLARNCKSTSGCFKCGSKKHFVRDCIQKEVDGHINPQCCFKCGKAGHLAKTCTKTYIYKNVRKRDSNNIACYNCGGLGHFAKDCTNKASATMDGGNAVIVENCYTCGEMGHVSSNCVLKLLK